MSDSVPLSRKFLSDAGGWKEMKRARSIHSSGKASNVSYLGGMLEGDVREGEKTLKVRMKIRSGTDIENHCPCFRTRRDGIICAHALAVGLEHIEPTERVSVRQTSTGARTVKEERPKVSNAWPVLVENAVENAVEARLFVVLPPGFIRAWDKGRIGIGIEIQINGERKLLKSVSHQIPLFLFPQDAALYQVLQTISPDSVPGMLSIGQDDFIRILNAVPGHSGFTFGKKEQAQIAYQAMRPELSVNDGNRFSVEWPANAEVLVTSRGIWALVDGAAFLAVAPGIPEKYQSVFIGGYQSESDELENDLSVLQKYFVIDQLNVVREVATVRLTLEGSVNHLEAVLSFSYPDSNESESSIRLRDSKTETEALGLLVRSGFDLKRGSSDEFVLKDYDEILRFFAHGFPKLQQKGWEVTTGERFEHALKKVEPVSGKMEFRGGSGENWFAMEVGFSTASGDSVSRPEIQRLLQMGQNSKKLANGKIAVLDIDLLDEFKDVLTDCEPDQQQPGTYQIDLAHAEYLRESATDMGFATTGELPWENRTSEVKFGKLPTPVSALLRPYQKTGIQWMQQLAANGRGGILADDMGLGKTLQTLCFIKSVGGLAFVVCPSSLVYNWIAEAEKFVPDLKAIAMEGPKRRETLKENPEPDIIVTSYALLRRDEELYRDCEFTTIILDEAQNIKNPEAKVSKAAHRLAGRYKFALTGTPIENSVRDLWSIMQFACPGYLGTRKDFSERFEKPLAGSEDSESVQRRLSRRLRTVILRRLKRDVASDLPEKIEQIIYCDLNPTQQEVYQKLLQESRETILDAEGGRKRMLALTALLRLRQTCCDLRLLGLQEIDPEKASVKADVLEEVLNEAIEGQHRVLVFSQFVEMLQILVPILAEKGINFCYLDGKTKKRGEVVAKFQENEDIPVFLISLKAGGVGLNLTGADTVIHIDPWWNPAVEAQATDRAHRIGQRRVVNSYKLIARNTVEEKILALQNRKRSLTENLLDGGAGIDLGDAGLSEDELMSFFD